MTKTCITCKEAKPFEDFQRDKARKDGRNPYCKICSHKRARVYWQKHRETYLARRKVWQSTPHGKRVSKNIKLKINFGISIEQYEWLVEFQCGRCAICLKPPKEGKVLVPDHDHKSGRLRGLLCPNCNVGIGMLQDSPELLRNAVEYLNQSMADAYMGVDVTQLPNIRSARYVQ